LFTGLTDRELEALRLLAAGHTAKTIAVRLGRSETSINERLRAARRKTGIGSSRELARLLEAQKSGTKKSIFRHQTRQSTSRCSPQLSGFKGGKE
jgi:DNA-binding CsgD family transcriptional regulator